MNIIIGKNNEAVLFTFLDPAGLTFGKFGNSTDFVYNFQSGFRFNKNTLVRGVFAVENNEENLLTALRARAGETQCNIMFGVNNTRNVKFDYVGQSNGSSFRIFVDDVFAYHYDNIDNVKHTTINGNLLVKGTITQNGSNTITHLAPIETSVNSISDFIVGAPVYLTGNVYKRKNDKWEVSTLEDTTDCICSVKTQGTWKEYVGICTNIDAKNNSVTFASHGDYLVRVTDSSCYCVGDEVFIDDDNKLKILAGATAVTAKIRRMTVGIITSIINENILAVFKS